MIFCNIAKNGKFIPSLYMQLLYSASAYSIKLKDFMIYTRLLYKLK